MRLSQSHTTVKQCRYGIYETVKKIFPHCTTTLPNSIDLKVGYSPPKVQFDFKILFFVFTSSLQSAWNSIYLSDYRIYWIMYGWYFKLCLSYVHTTRLSSVRSNLSTSIIDWNFDVHFNWPKAYKLRSLRHSSNASVKGKVQFYHEGIIRWF